MKKLKKKTAITEKNRPEQLNPNNKKYWKARKHKNRPDNWEELIKIKN